MPRPPPTIPQSQIQRYQWIVVNVEHLSAIDFASTQRWMQWKFMATQVKVVPLPASRFPVPVFHFSPFPLPSCQSKVTIQGIIYGKLNCLSYLWMIQIYKEAKWIIYLLLRFPALTEFNSNSTLKFEVPLLIGVCFPQKPLEIINNLWCQLVAVDGKHSVHVLLQCKCFAFLSFLLDLWLVCTFLWVKLFVFIYFMYFCVSQLFSLVPLQLLLFAKNRK